MAEETDTPEVETSPSLLDPQPAEESSAPPEGEQPEGERPVEGQEPGGEQAEGDTDDADEEGDKDAGAPDEYADFAAPEGIELDADAIGSFKDVAKELNLSQDNAQKLVDIAADLVGKQTEAFTRQIAETTQAWKNEVETSELGAGASKGLKSEVASRVAAARDAFATPELMEMLNDTKFGDHPEMVRLFDRIGKAIAEDNFVQPGKPVTQTSFFDHPTSKAASGR